MDLFKVLQEPYFFTILFLTSFAAVAIGFLFFKAFTAIPKKNSNSGDIVIKRHPNSFLKGDFNKSIQFVKKNNTSVNMEKENHEGTEEEHESFLKGEKNDEVFNTEEDSDDFIIDREDVKLLPPQKELTTAEENQLSTDVYINDIVDKTETFDIFSKMGELHGKLATAKTRIEARNFRQSLTDEEREEEEHVKEKQLREIFEMLQAQEEKFGIHSKSELEEQFKFYAL
uniref:Matrix-remodeling-associated protein 7 n=1 Tax=Strongyloides venezuelensis TaxID=75913 RepID=A0A0K0FQP6_STRVS